MAATAVYGLRYPALSNSPNVPLDVQNLAQDVEDEIVRMDAVLALVDVKGRNRRSTNITTTATTSATAQRVMTARASVLAGHTYRIFGRTALSHSSATAAAQVHFVYTTNDVEPVVTGTIMFRENRTFGGIGVPESLVWSCLYDAGTDHVLRVTPCMFTAIGSGTLTWECGTGPNPSDLVIEDRGLTVAISGTIY